MEILELRSAITEIKNSLKGLNRRFKLSEERFRKRQDRVILTI